MLLLLELLPGVTFFIAYRWGDLYIATLAAMLTAALPILMFYSQKKPISMHQWISLGGATVLGTASIVFQNIIFIKWKPTIAYWVLASILVLNVYRNKVSFIRALLEPSFELPTPIWKNLECLWAASFIVFGFLNIIVAYTVDTQTWIYFKIFGVFGLNLLCIIGQIIYLTPFTRTDHAAKNLDR